MNPALAPREAPPKLFTIASCVFKSGVFRFPLSAFRFYPPRMDVFTPEKRSEVMSRIRGRDTKPELALRSMLHRLGYRFTTNNPEYLAIG